MAVLKSAFGGDVVTIGNFHGSDWPSRNTWGDGIRTPDAGVPLHMYDPGGLDALAVWKTQPAVRRVIGFGARQFAMVPWKAYKRKTDTDRQRMSKSPMESLLSSPERFRSGFNLLETLYVDKMIYDRWCVVYWAGRAGQRPRLLRIPPRLLEIKSNWLGEVTQVMLLNPVPGEPNVDLTDAPKAMSWGWTDQAAGGVSWLTTLRENLNENRRSVQWRAHQWEESPKMTGVLKHPDSFKSEADRNSFMQSWRTWRDTPRAAGTPILEQGMEYLELKGMTARDAQELEGRRYTDEEVATALHFPPELLGLRESTFSNLVALRQMLFQTVLGPVYSEFHQAFNGQLVEHVDAEPKLYVEADRDAAVAGSLLEQAQLFQTLTGSPVMTVGEARARMNLPELPNTDKLIVPMNVTAGGQASPRDSGSQNRKPNTEPEQETP